MSDKIKTIAVDFDGVISDYRGWKGKGIFGPPIDGVSEFLGKLRKEKWRIIIYTTRSETDKIAEYLDINQIPYDYINFNPENHELGLSSVKPISDVYLDDRAIRFRGVWDEELMHQIKESSPHWRQREVESTEITETEKEVLKVIRERWKKGREKYGVGINFTQHKTAEGWLEEAIEEAADMLQYLVAMKKYLQNNKKQWGGE